MKPYRYRTVVDDRGRWQDAGHAEYTQIHSIERLYGVRPIVRRTTKAPGYKVYALAEARADG